MIRNLYKGGATLSGSCALNFVALTQCVLRLVTLMLLAAVLILNQGSALAALAQEAQGQDPFRLSVTQSNLLPSQQPRSAAQFAAPAYPIGTAQFNQSQPQFAYPTQAQSSPPNQSQLGRPTQPQFANQNRPQFSGQIQMPPTRIFSAAAASHSGPSLMSDSSPLAYDLTICQDDPNFHPPYLLPRPEILNPGSGFGESPQNVQLWQNWADHVAMAAWSAWRQHALPEFGCAEIDITLNRDGSFKAKRGIYSYYSPRTDLPVEQAPFLMQLDPFLNYLRNTKVFRIPDAIRMSGSQTIEFQIQVGVRQKDRANPYSWCGFMNDWKWWTGSGLPVYHRIECELNGLGK